MRPNTQNTVYYAPEPIPQTIEVLPSYIERELFKIKATIELLSAGHLDMVHVAPTKPRTGDIRLADGTNWNPGSGAGFYGYYGGAWVKLG